MFLTRTLVLLAFGCAAALGMEERTPEARLLSLKKVLNRYLVENRDVSIHYELYNVGDATAVNVKLIDRTFPPSDFDVVSGSLEATFPKIPAGTNVTHSVVVRPNKYGMFNFTSAEVTYELGERNSEIRRSLTTEPGQGGIMPEVDFERRFSPHYLDWAVFLLLCMPSLLVPFLLYNSSKSKYENLAKKSK
ncbi:translocon-associated protein subunit beta isoform 1 [Tropilaelaps mercedesae]|uniref:Translocon-associated protein subunit beta n=1 Tax=Tropilaelaps mercedesae TaxID=418985 RepID=A0A1V9XZ18_9ACAR|nr:translocon-associated protein subunit beta isoform 1 [Tropilaelaps mercedesae]